MDRTGKKIRKRKQELVPELPCKCCLEANTGFNDPKEKAVKNGLGAVQYLRPDRALKQVWKTHSRFVELLCPDVGKFSQTLQMGCGHTKRAALYLRKLS